MLDSLFGGLISKLITLGVIVLIGAVLIYVFVLRPKQQGKKTEPAKGTVRQVHAHARCACEESADAELPRGAAIHSGYYPT